MSQTSCTVSPAAPSPQAGPSLQISPNLEALLQHDELTRRSTGSPTSMSRSTRSHNSSEFPISLPPPPPRNSLSSKKAVSLYEPRPRDVRRKRSLNFVTDRWPDALPVCTSDTAATSQAHSTSGTAIPNPYINPAPVVARTDSVLDDAPFTPKPGDKPVPSELSSRSAAEDRSRTPMPAADSRLTRSSSAGYRSSPALHKVERILSKGRDSLSMLATAATSGSLRLKADSLDVDRNRHHTEDLESSNPPTPKASPLRQDSLTGPPRLSLSIASTPYSNDVATIPPHAIEGACSIKAKSTLASTNQHRGSARSAHPAQSKTTSTRSLSTTSSSSSSSVHVPANPVHTYPALSLPNLTLPSMMSTKPSRPRTCHGVTDDDDNDSFIDFFSLSIGEDDGKSDTRPHKQQLSTLAIPSSTMYQNSSENLSSVSLATMRFAPPSPTSGESPMLQRPSSPSSSSIAVSTMIFAPPSPATELSPLAFREASSPCSATSLTPIEFAPPSSPMHRQRGKLDVSAPFKLGPLKTRRRRAGKRSLSLSPRPPSQELVSLPPTTNLLGRDERADLIRRNRKLTQVFGQTPGAEAGPLDMPRKFKKPPAALTSLLSAGKQRNHRQVMSVSHAGLSPSAKVESHTLWQLDDLWSPGGRRYSIPLTPSSFTFYLDDDDDPKSTSTSDHRGVHSLADPQLPRNSSSSFIDLSDDEEPSRGDEVSVFSSLDGHKTTGHRPIYHFSSTPSLVESLDPDKQAEVERRRKRDKLAKLHRFLGSQVPPDLILGSTTCPSYPASSPSPPMEGLRDNRMWSRKCEASLGPENFDRGKEELDQREKALNVRRAHKMEKLFGTPPPQTLFHTRQGPSTLSRSLPHSQPTSPVSPVSNLNQSAYKGKSIYRLPQTESARLLLPPRTDGSSVISQYPESPVQSLMYLNYQHSLNSLVDIIDRDDRESLLELHRFLNSELSESPVEGQRQVDRRRSSMTSSLRSERRHSLPVSTSLVSLTSEYLAAPPQTSEFQVRRRRAAKLTSFFGVDYRELIHDVLESIERGVEEERRRGNLQPEEVELLLHRVRSLKSQQQVQQY
ncbi:hypothetical protein ID866_6997 [Astraeus odoratus]|nr:hypothetical protein ID866_6997 [Astraeus odoratus]